MGKRWETGHRNNIASRPEWAGIRPARSIRVRLIVFCLLFTVLFSGVCVVASTHVSREAIRAENENSARIVLAQSKQLIDERLYSLLSQMIAFCNEPSMRKIMLNLANSQQAEFPPQAYINIDQSLSSLYAYNHQLIDSIVVYLNDGKAHFCKGNEGLYAISFSFGEWYARYGSDRCHWLNYHPLDGVVDRRGARDVYTLFQLLGTPDAKTNALILLNINKAYFDSILEQRAYPHNGYLAIFSEDGASYFCHEGQAEDESIRQSVISRMEASGSLHCEKQGETMYVVYDTLTTNHWRIASIMSESDLLSGVSRARTLLLLSGSVLTALCLAYALFFANQLVNPLGQLAAKVSAVGSRDVVFDVETKDEIGVLNDGLAHMMRRIEELNRQVRLELDQKRIAEIAGLQAQINPHFLYNTLYDIQQLCELSDTRTAAEMVGKLAQFYRIGVSRGSEMIPLRDQLAHVISYLEIQHLRYRNVFDYSLNVPDELLDAPTVKLMLQPLLENAIYHGVKLRAEPGGRIEIRAWQEGDSLCMEVCDNGPGVPLEVLKTLRAELEAGAGVAAAHSYGLRNVHSRLRLRYGGEYGLGLKSEYGLFFCVDVRMPLETGKGREAHD